MHKATITKAVIQEISVKKISTNRNKPLEMRAIDNEIFLGLGFLFTFQIYNQLL